MTCPPKTVPVIKLVFNLNWTHKEDGLSRWVTALAARRHINVAAVAMANKTARMAWVIMTKGVDYDPELAAA